MRGRPYQGERRSMPIASWPEQDRLAWEDALRSRDLFDRPNIAGAWAMKRRRIVGQSYGYWLMWLAQTSRLDPKLPAAERVSMLLVGEFIEHLRQRLAPADRPPLGGPI